MLQNSYKKVAKVTKGLQSYELNIKLQKFANRYIPPNFCQKVSTLISTSRGYKQVLSESMSNQKKPVFTVGFKGSKVLEGEEVCVLKECAPAQSIGKTVVDRGYLFVWDPSESVPYLLLLKTSKDASFVFLGMHAICASGVNVPQFDEEIKPVELLQGSRMVPAPTAIPAESEEVPRESSPVVEERKGPPPEDMAVDEEASPSSADVEGLKSEP